MFSAAALLAVVGAAVVVVGSTVVGAAGAVVGAVWVELVEELLTLVVAFGSVVDGAVSVGRGALGSPW